MFLYNAPLSNVLEADVLYIYTHTKLTNFYNFIHIHTF